jgi:hypothetical protein
MEIKVLKTTIASKNELGNQSFKYLEGNIYDIYQELAEVFLNEGWGEKAIKEKAIKEYENKAIDNLKNKQFKPKK